jgi:hypothetical protein
MERQGMQGAAFCPPNQHPVDRPGTAIALGCGPSAKKLGHRAIDQ